MVSAHGVYTFPEGRRLSLATRVGSPPARLNRDFPDDHLSRPSPDNIQILENRTTVPPQRKLYPLPPSDCMILVIGPHSEGHSVISLVIRTRLSCRFLLAVVFPIAGSFLSRRGNDRHDDAAQRFAVIEPVPVIQ